MSTRTVLKREARVALSTRAQPVWFRILKWIVALTVSALLWRTPQFWWWIAGAVVLGISVHLFWRWKTKGWTEPWGGWNDLEAADEDRAQNETDTTADRRRP